MNKLLKMPKETVYVVGYWHSTNDMWAMVAVFKTKQSAEQFINECIQIESTGGKLKFRNKLGKIVQLLDGYSHARNLRVLETETYGEEIPFFNK